MSRLFILLMILCIALVGCQGGDSTPVLATPTSDNTVRDVRYVDCFGRVQEGFERVNTNDNPCLRGDTIEHDLGTEDGRYASLYVGYFYWQQPGSRETFAYVNTGQYEYRGDDYNGMAIELTQLDGQFGVQFNQDFEQGICYLIKQTGRLQMFGGAMTNVSLAGEIFTTDGERFVLPAQAFPSRFSDYEVFWLVETNDLFISTVVVIWTELTWASYLTGSSNIIHAVEVLDAPPSYCEGSGVVRLE